MHTNNHRASGKQIIFTCVSIESEILILAFLVFAKMSVGIFRHYINPLYRTVSTYYSFVCIYVVNVAIIISPSAGCYVCL